MGRFYRIFVMISVRTASGQQAIVDYAKEKNIPLLDVSGFNSVTGLGLAESVNGLAVTAGNILMMSKYFIETNEADEDALKFFRRR